MYEGTTSIATCDGRESCEGGFDVKMGLAQGDPLSPTLFAVFIDPLIKTIQERCEGVRVGDSGMYLHSLMFADDQLGLGGAQKL